jgi:hypothetical protein
MTVHGLFEKEKRHLHEEGENMHVETSDNLIPTKCLDPSYSNEINDASNILAIKLYLSEASSICKLKAPRPIINKQTIRQIEHMLKHHIFQTPM